MLRDRFELSLAGELERNGNFHFRFCANDDKIRSQSTLKEEFFSKSEVQPGVKVLS